MKRSRPRYRSRREVPCGRLRRRVAAILKESLGIEIAPEDLHVQAPAYAKLDLCRWWGTYNDAYGTPHNVCSWSTMADIARAGKVGWVTKFTGEVSEIA